MSLTLEQIKKLHQKKYRKEFQTLLIEGEHLISELEKTAFVNCELLLSEKYTELNSRFPKRFLTNQQLKKISEVDNPQGIAALVPIDNFSQIKPALRTLYLEEVQDPGNLGTILRTVAWFGGFNVWLSPGSVDPFNSKVVRASMGSIFHVPIRQNVPFNHVSSTFKSLSYLDLNGAPLSTPSFQNSDCLIFGNEGRGVSQSVRIHPKSEAYSISGNGTIESLNLATAVNMSLYELNR